MSLNATTQPLSLAARMRKALPALPYSQSKLALPLTMDELEEEDDGFTGKFERHATREQQLT